MIHTLQAKMRSDDEREKELEERVVYLLWPALLKGWIKSYNLVDEINSQTREMAGKKRHVEVRNN